MTCNQLHTLPPGSSFFFYSLVQTFELENVVSKIRICYTNNYSTWKRLCAYNTIKGWWRCCRWGEACCCSFELRNAQIKYWIFPFLECPYNSFFLCSLLLQFYESINFFLFLLVTAGGKRREECVWTDNKTRQNHSSICAHREIPWFFWKWQKTCCLVCVQRT